MTTRPETDLELHHGAPPATLPVTAVIFQTSTMHGWLLVPYQLWIGIAASLSCGYAVLNR